MMHLNAMHRFDLLQARSEFYTLATSTDQFISFSEKNGLDLHRIEGFAGLTGILKITHYQDGRFDWSSEPDAPDAMICEAFDDDGETVIDLVAWLLHDPNTVMSMFGNAAWLGAWTVWNPASYQTANPLLVHRNPLEWLRAGCEGAAIVNPHLAAREIIDLPGRIAVQDRAYGAELASIVKGLLDPAKILVPSPKRWAA